MIIKKSYRANGRILAAISAAVVLLGVIPPSAVAYINGFDVYSGDGTVTWSSAKAGGYDFAFVKATEGVNFIDSKFATNMSGANTAGMYVGPYHFCRIDSKNGVDFTTYNGGAFAYNSATQTNKDAWYDATSEANDFIDSIRPYYLQTGTTHYLPPVADVEGLPNFGSSSLNKTFISNWIQLFSDTVYDALGVRPIMYASKSSANSNFTATVAGEHKLWIAWWKGTGTTSPPVQSDTPNWPAWSFWQWSDGTDSIAQANQVPGTTVSVDRDVYSGTLTQLSALKLQLVAGDYNHNNVVDASDYVLYRKERALSDTLQQYLTTDPSETYSSPWEAANGDNSGASKDIINTADYTYWRARFGKTLSGSGSGSGMESSSAPEPSSVLLLLLGGLMWTIVRKRPQLQ
jgi:GH25 family lysozyme M1 (1,4-beta-N-acetylmuramidase)